MGDVFTELVFHRKPRVSDTLIKAGLIVLIVVFALAGLFFNSVYLTAALLVGVGSYFILPRLNVEYEYSYVNGIMDVAAVYSGQSRKELMEIRFTESACVAPASSHHLEEFGTVDSVTDYTTGSDSEGPIYGVVFTGDTRKKILFHTNEEMIRDLQNRIPQKFHRD